MNDDGQQQTSGSELMGSGEWTYRMESQWARLPDGWELGEVAAVAVDARDDVYVFTRGTEHPLMVFDRDGNFLRSWGEGGIFKRPHGIAYGVDGFIYCTDDGTHSVKKFSTDGTLQLEIGIPGRPATPYSGAPFHRCTHTALSRQGDIFVSDGYGNARVHKFTPDGRHILSWGDFGSDPGKFNLPHNITSDPDGWLYVADRENHRVQVFDDKGRYETQWNNLHRPCALCTQSRRRPVSFIGEIGPGFAINREYPNLGPRVSILDADGKLLSRLGDQGVGVAPGQFLGPHGIAVDSRDDIYVAELGTAGWMQRYADLPVPGRLPNLKKLVRMPSAAQASGHV